MLLYYINLQQLCIFTTLKEQNPGRIMPLYAERFFGATAHELTFAPADIGVFVRDVFGIFSEKFAVPDASLKIFTSEIEMNGVNTGDKFTVFVFAPEISADDVVCHGGEIRREKGFALFWRKNAVNALAVSAP